LSGLCFEGIIISPLETGRELILLRDEPMISEEKEHFLRHLDTSLFIKMAVVEGIFSVKNARIDQFAKERNLHFICYGLINPIMLLNALGKEFVPFIHNGKVLRKNDYRVPLAPDEADEVFEMRPVHSRRVACQSGRPFRRWWMRGTDDFSNMHVTTLYKTIKQNIIAVGE
jgi:hypothetical protein